MDFLERSWDGLRMFFSQAFEEWSVRTIGRDLLLNLAAGIGASIIVFLIARRWPLIRSYLSRDGAAFRRLFGPGAIRSGEVLVTLDVYQDIRLLPADLQERLGLPGIVAANLAAPAASGAPPANDERRDRDAQAALARGMRHFKVFPDGHLAAFPGAREGVLGYCSARGAGYLIDRLSRIPSVAVRVEAVSDAEVAGRWDATFINLGSSSSNIKTDDIKHLHDGSLFTEDMGELTIPGKDVQKEKERSRKGWVLKRSNPFSPGHCLLVCAGLGEWGTSGAAWYLAQNWKRLSRRFGSRPFMVVLSVLPQADGSAHEILFVGQESIRYRLLRRIRAVRSRVQRIW